MTNKSISIPFNIVYALSTNIQKETYFLFFYVNIQLANSWNDNKERKKSGIFCAKVELR